MPDWTLPMQQSFEYMLVDPGTWKDMRKIENIASSSISRDYKADTLGSASFKTTELLGESYVRTYLITIQNGIRERTPLGTHLVQTPSSSYDGRVKGAGLQGYTPLIELKENSPVLGYSILKNTNIMDTAYLIVRENLRAPVVKTVKDKDLYSDFVANSNDTWCSFVSDLIANADYNLGLDELGRVIFEPIQETAALQPVWTFSNDNSSILYPEIDIDHDLFGIPNVVEVTHSSGSAYITGVARNDDENSPTSTYARGREIIKRVVNPNFGGQPSQAMVDEYARKTLKEASSLEYTVSYKHGYCPVRIGDCVRLIYPQAGLNGIKARVITQEISCEPGCPVSETAVFTKKFWGGAL